MKNFRRLALQFIQRWMFPTAGASYGPRQLEVARGTYDATNALSAMGAFPWVWTAVKAISDDLAGCPLIAVRTDEKGKRHISHVHPFLKTIERAPQGGQRLRRQIYADLALAGNAYLRVVGRVGAGGVIVRLHPGETAPNIDMSNAVIHSYKWGNHDIPVAEIIHLAEINWAKGAASAVGESPIHSLHEGLLAIQDTRNHARKAAARGRLEMLFTPEKEMQFNEATADKISALWDSLMKKGRGAMVVRQGVKATPLSLTPRDLEFEALNAAVREEVLATFSVPPVRAGLSTANYGTSKSQMRMYWERLKHFAALINDGLSRFAGEGWHIEHDLTRVEALQVSYTERQQRANDWVSGFGVSPADAASYEGFHDLPVPNGLTADDVNSTRKPAKEVDEPQKTDDVLAVVLRKMGLRYKIRVANGDMGPEAATQETVYLAENLLGLGASSSVAMETAQNAVALCHKAALVAGGPGGAEIIDLVETRAFGLDHAKRIAAELEAA